MPSYLLIDYTWKKKKKKTYGIFPLRGVVYLAIVGYIGYVNNGYYKLDKV
jgi:hypothetical protein